DRTQEQIERLGGCPEPVRLTGQTTPIDSTTGEVLRSYNTTEEPAPTPACPSPTRTPPSSSGTWLVYTSPSPRDRRSQRGCR
ncbi:replication initiator, partial [Streptomyces flavovirens]